MEKEGGGLGGEGGARARGAVRRADLEWGLRGQSGGRRKEGGQRDRKEGRKKEGTWEFRTPGRRRAGKKKD